MLRYCKAVTRLVALSGLAIMLVAIAQAGRVLAAPENQGQSQPPQAALNTVSPDALQAANELFAILSEDTITQWTDQIIAQMWPLMERQLRTDGKVDDATLSELHGELARIQRADMAEMMKDAPLVYAHYLTVQELQELTTFYHSPAGEKALRVLPRITDELFKRINSRLQVTQHETTDAFSRILRQHGYIK